MQAKRQQEKWLHQEFFKLYLDGEAVADVYGRRDERYHQGQELAQRLANLHNACEPDGAIQALLEAARLASTLRLTPLKALDDAITNAQAALGLDGGSE